MKTYNVKQIAEMLETNPETVRRWIRDGKLAAEQSSRKGGNTVTEEELKRFMESRSKYRSKSSLVGLAAFGIVAAVSYVARYLQDRGNQDLSRLPDDVQEQLSSNVVKLREAVDHKRELINQTQEEISEMERQIEQYRYLMEHKDVVEGAIRQVTGDDKNL